MNREFIYTITESVLFDKNITDLDRKIYMIIRSFMDTTGSCFASNDWVAKKLEIEGRSVVRSIGRLEKQGYVIRFTENDQRYLKINYSKFSDTESPPPMTLQSPPHDPTVTPPHDPTVTQLVSNINNTKYIKNISAKAPIPEKNGLANPDFEYQETLYKKEDKKPTGLKEITKDNPHNIPMELIDEWKQIRKSKITPTVWKRLNLEILKCNCSPREAFEEMISRGWSTIKSEWINKGIKKPENKTFFDHTSTDWINLPRGIL